MGNEWPLSRFVYIVEYSPSVLTIALAHIHTDDIIAFYPDGTFYILNLDKMYVWQLDDKGKFIYADGYMCWTGTKPIDDYINATFQTWILETGLL